MEESIELRMTLAEGQEEVKMAKHVEAALISCSNLNNRPNTWAEIDIVPTNVGQVVHIRTGDIWDGVKQKNTRIICVTMGEGGEVYFVGHTIP